MSLQFELVAQEIVYEALAANSLEFVVSGGVWVDANDWNDEATWWSWAPVSANVYDDVPYLPEGMPRENFPYVTIGSDSTVPWDTDDTKGKEITIQLDVWSRSAGFKEAKAIMAEVYNILNRLDIAKVGYHVVDCLYEFSETLRDPDGETRHGVMRFKLTIQKET